MSNPHCLCGRVVKAAASGERDLRFDTRTSQTSGLKTDIPVARVPDGWCNVASDRSG